MDRQGHRRIGAFYTAPDDLVQEERRVAVDVVEIHFFRFLRAPGPLRVLRVQIDVRI